MNLKNDFQIMGDYTIIFIKYKNQIYECLIDSEDLEKVSKCINWVMKCNHKADVNSMSARGYVDDKMVQMHRYILDYEGRKVIDHINHNALDNRKSNLRLATVVENARNRRGPTSQNKTGYRNVFYDSTREHYSAKINFEGKQIGKGGFKTAEEANEYAIELRKKYFKEFNN